MLRQSDLEHMKDWRLRRLLTHLRKAREGNETFGGGLKRLLREGLNEEIPQVEREIARRKQRTAQSAD